MRARRGFTLVELALAVALGTALLVSLHQLYLGGVRLFHGSQRQLQAVQVAQLVVETIEQDVRTLLLRDALDPSFMAELEPRDSLELLTSEQGPGGPRGALVQGARVEYSLEPSPTPGISWLRRNDQVYPHLPLARLTFQPRLAGPPERPLHFLQLTVTAVDTTGKTSFSLVSLVALDEMNRWRRARYWQMNPSVDRYRAVP